MHKYRLISKKGEGTFSEVLKAQSIKSGKHVAIKCMKNHFDSIDQVNNLREIQALRRLAGHPNIIKLHEVLYDEPTGRLALVFELMDMNLYEAIKGRRHYLPEAKVKHYTYEMLKALDHMHRNGIFHRDVKPENLLLLDDEIKLADLGSCRGIYSRQPFTEYISTRWYRAPECLLTDGYYKFKMDLFAAGCVCFEIVALFPLFPGQNEMDQIQKIHNVLGTPAAELLARKFRRNASHMDFNFPEKKGTGIERLIPHAEPELVELMKKLVRYDPDERILARQALKDPYFRELREAEKDLASAVAQLQSGSAAGSTNGSRSRDPMAKAGISATSSVSADHENPEQTHEPSRTSSPGPEESRGALPSIRHERRKAGGVEEDGHDDGMVLPPIGGLKGKRDSKMKTTFKTAANGIGHHAESIRDDQRDSPRWISMGPSAWHHGPWLHGASAQREVWAWCPDLQGVQWDSAQHWRNKHANEYVLCGDVLNQPTQLDHQRARRGCEHWARTSHRQDEFYLGAQFTAEVYLSLWREDGAGEETLDACGVTKPPFGFAQLAAEM